ILDAAGRVTAGSAMFDGMDMLHARESELEEIRGREASMIFQSPRTALNPIRKVGKQIEDILLRHGSVTRAQARERAIEIPGKLPDLRRSDLPACRFSERCARRETACDAPLPRTHIEPEHLVACWRPL